MMHEKLKKKEISVPVSINEILDGKKAGHLKIIHYKEVAQMREGQNFGELALMTSKPRSATIFCNKDTDLAVLDKADY